jgi:hypothetical protein
MGMLFDFLSNPGIVIGSLVGIGLAAGLHWLLPELGPVVGALVIVGSCMVGFVVELFASSRQK